MNITGTPPVVEAQAPQVKAGSGYEHAEGDLYIPEGHEPRSPDLEITVMDGTVQLKRQTGLEESISNFGKTNKKLESDRYLNDKEDKYFDEIL
jgi:hypothetical protein